MAAPTRNLFAALTGSTGTTSYAPNLAALVGGAAVGDCIIVFVSTDGNPTLTLGGTSAADGWAILGQAADATNAVRASVYRYEVAVADSIPVLTISSTASEAFSAQAFRIRPSSGQMDVQTISASAQGSSTNPNPPALANSSGATRDMYYLTFWAGDGVVLSTVAPTNFANHQSASISNSANGSSIGSADRTVAAVANGASQDPGTFTRATEQWVSYTLGCYEILAPVAAVASPLTTSSPALGQPGLTQTHVVAGGDTAGSPELGQPALTQTHVVEGSSLTTGAPALGSPALTENTPAVALVANNLTTAAPELGTTGGGGINPATLFGVGDLGGYWEFDDASTLAVNADGTGGVPGIGQGARSATDKGPNAKRLRNTVGSVTRTATGVEVVAGSGYGLFSFAGGDEAGIGTWEAIPGPYEMIIAFTPLGWPGQYTRVITDAGGPMGLLTGATAGSLLWYDGPINPDFAAPIGVEIVVSVKSASELRVNGGAPAAISGVSHAWGGLLVGSSSGGQNMPGYYRRVFVIGRHLSDSERAGATITIMGGGGAVPVGITQRHGVTASALATAAPALGTPAAAQGHTLAATALATSSPSLGAPALSQAASLVANGLTIGSPALGTPAVTETAANTRVLLSWAALEVRGTALAPVMATANSLTTAAPALGAPALTQRHVVGSGDLTTAAPALGAPALTQRHALAAQALALAAPALGAPALTQRAALAANSLTTASPALGAPALTQRHALAAQALALAAPALGTPGLLQNNALAGLGLETAAPALGAPALTQRHALSGQALETSAPVLGTPAAVVAVHFVASALAGGAPALGSPALTQRHALAANALPASGGVFDVLGLLVGVDGAYYRPSALGPLWADAAATVPAVLGGIVRRIDDLSPNGHHLVAPSDTASPILAIEGGRYYLDFDGVDDEMRSAANVDVGAATAVAAVNIGSTSGNYATILSFAPGAVNGRNYGLLLEPGNANNSFYVAEFPGSLHAGNRIWLNGVLGNSTALDTAAVYSVDGTGGAADLHFDGLQIMRDRGFFGRFMRARLYGLLLVGATQAQILSDTDRQKAENTLGVLAGTVAPPSASPELGQPALTQTGVLIAEGLATSAPVLGEPALTQRAALAADDLAPAAPDLGTPSLSQRHALAANGLTTGAPALGTPIYVSLGEFISQPLVTGPPVLGAPTLGITVHFVAPAVDALPPELGQPALTQRYGLVAPNVSTGAPGLGSPALGQYYGLVAPEVATAAPELGQPALFQFIWADAVPTVAAGGGRVAIASPRARGAEAGPVGDATAVVAKIGRVVVASARNRNVEAA